MKSNECYDNCTVLSIDLTRFSTSDIDRFGILDPESEKAISCIPQCIYFSNFSSIPQKKKIHENLRQAAAARSQP